MKRPLRSVLIGDCDYYPSEYVFGVAQGMTLLGHTHTQVNIRQPIEVIARRVTQVTPDIIWGHMLLWAPPAEGVLQEGRTLQLLDLCERWRHQGAKVVIHDGDARAETRFPWDISDSVDLALCNHTVSRAPWGIRQIRWPYFAFVQREMAEPVPEFGCALAFAGRRGGGLYEGRTKLLDTLAGLLGPKMRCWPSETVPHTLFRTPELAASATAVLGYGRPESPGWCDVRVFQYPGAGGILLHDDVQGYLEEGVHYLRYRAGDAVEVMRIVEMLERDLVMQTRIRRAAFRYVQQVHTSIQRVAEVLRELNL